MKKFKKEFKKNKRNWRNERNDENIAWESISISYSISGCGFSEIGSDFFKGEEVSYWSLTTYKKYKVFIEQQYGRGEVILSLAKEKSLEIYQYECQDHIEIYKKLFSEQS